MFPSHDTGYQGASSNTGYQGASSNTGYQGASSNSGKFGCAMSHAYKGRVMAEGENQVLFCSEFDDNYQLVSAACGITGQDGIEPNVWYTCRDYKLVPVE